MRILKIEDKYLKKSKSTYIYLLSKGKWQLLHEIRDSSSQKVYDYFIRHISHVDYAYMGLYYEYRNILYSLYNEIKIIIQKEAIIGLFEKKLGIKGKAYEEAATTSCSLECNKVYYNEEIDYFVYSFYQAQSKQEAVKLYENWQISIPLGNKNFYKVLKTMECYFDEIINYFESQ